ncbi:MAG: PilN domain-containing protein [Candidatus Omnitrophica bacterium]|nr:PilN domain-containing protein [Candidatus Omnitrophota bacterium]
MIKMLKTFLGRKNAKAIFVLEIGERYLKTIKFSANRPREIIGVHIEDISGLDENAIINKTTETLHNLAYANNHIILSFPRSQVTFRCFHLPTSLPQEIEKMVIFQASRYLPYPAEELITAYEILSIDKNGYAKISLTIVHKEAINRIIKILTGIKIRKFNIILNSYGLSALYNYINFKTTNPIMLLDVDSGGIEIAILWDKKLYFTRFFKLNKQLANWQGTLIDEVKKTCDAYLRETKGEYPKKMVIFSEISETAKEVVEILNNQSFFASETLRYSDKIQIAEDVKTKINNPDYSILSLLGLGLQAHPESLSLLPKELKQKMQLAKRNKERWRMFLFISAVALIWFLAIVKNLDNKARYVESLQTEINKIENEAKPLEEIEKKLIALKSKKGKKEYVSGMLLELQNILPNGVYLVSFGYEEDKEIVLRGQADELSLVFSLVSSLEKSKIFSKTEIKVRYATKRKTRTGEIVDFEINCNLK